MTIRGIDVSSWNGWPYDSVTEQAYRESDFAIVKATEGAGYVNPHFDNAMHRAQKDGKLLGFYHYADGGSASAEAAHLWNVARGWNKKAIPVLDWENGGNAAWGSTTWPLAFCEAYHALSGVWPVVYAGPYVLDQVASCARHCALWVAGYPDYRQSWTPPAYPYGTGPWGNWTIWQYTSAGGVDRNVANLDRKGWLKLAGSSTQEFNQQKPGKAVNSKGMKYRVHIAKKGWQEAVHDGQVAGTTGNGLSVEALKITPPEGVVLDVKAHVQDIGWKTWKNIRKGKSSGTGSSENDPIIGTVGQGKRLEAIEIVVRENPKKLKISTRVHVGGFGWTGWVPAGYTAGTVGISRGIEAIQIKAV